MSCDDQLSSGHGSKSIPSWFSLALQTFAIFSHCSISDIPTASDHGEFPVVWTARYKYCNADASCPSTVDPDNGGPASSLSANRHPPAALAPWSSLNNNRHRRRSRGKYTWHRTIRHRFPHYLLIQTPCRSKGKPCQSISDL